jgi:hypothetical protein
MLPWPYAGDREGGLANLYLAMVISARCLDGGGAVQVVVTGEQLTWTAQVVVKKVRNHYRAQNYLHTPPKLSCDLDAWGVEGPSLAAKTKGMATVNVTSSEPVTGSVSVEGCSGRRDLRQRLVQMSAWK